MSCENVQELISPLLDQQIPADEREKVLAHLESCRPCSTQFESMQKVRAMMRNMNDAPMPVALTAELRVVASHERERRLRVASGRVRYWSGQARLWFDNLMRPVFLPLAGGLLSAAIIFCVLVPTLSFQHEGIDSALVTDPYAQYGHRPVWGVVVLSSGNAFAPGGGMAAPTIEPAYTESPDDSTVVWLAIGENGKVQDYRLTKGQLTSDMIEIISMSKFNPTFQGVPSAGLVKMVQRRAPVRHAVRS